MFWNVMVSQVVHSGARIGDLLPALLSLFQLAYSEMNSDSERVQVKFEILQDVAHKGYNIASSLSIFNCFLATINVSKDTISLQFYAQRSCDVFYLPILGNFRKFSKF